jgi:hypothetical protein
VHFTFHLLYQGMHFVKKYFAILVSTNISRAYYICGCLVASLFGFQ